MSSHTWLLRIADQLGEVPSGSAEADRAIHGALDSLGPPPAYTTAKSAAAQLLPPGFEWRQPDYSGGAVYASCKRAGMDGEFPYPHHGQWSATEPLAMCEAVLRAGRCWRRDEAILAMVDRLTQPGGLSIQRRRFDFD